jgi:gliding motility-associated-like protein
LCDGSSLNLTVAPTFSSYLWNTGATTNTLTVTTAGTYVVTVTNTEGCEKTKKYTINSSGIATITGVIINDFAENENSVLIEYTGIGNYEFTLDGFYFQDNPLFNNVAAGKYFAYARDKNGCGLSAPYILYVMDYPKYFTPNGDGYNDIWEIKNLDLFPNSTLFIFDRYGKLLKQVTNSDTGWNGTLNGNQMPADDYWFTLKLADGRETKGHFSLKR